MVAPMVAAAGIGALGNLAGGIFGSMSANKAADDAYTNQKHAMKHQIQWKVEDAVLAGLHPLAGLGVNPVSTPAASVGGEILGNSLSDMGQNIGRAAEAYMTPQDKTASRMVELQMERGGLENELLRTQIASQRMRNLQQATPGLPGPSVIANLPGAKRSQAALPGLGSSDTPWKVDKANVGQDAEGHYGETGNIHGFDAWLKDALRNNGYEYLLEGTGPMASRHLAYLKSILMPDKNVSTHYKDRW